MRKTFANPWVATIVLMLYAVWTVLFHQLVLTAWTLQYSYLGVLGILVAAALLFVSFPREDRKPVFYFTAYSMLAGIGLGNVLTQPAPWNAVDLVVFLILALALGRYVVRIHFVQVIAVVAALVALELWVPFADMGVLSAFTLRYDGALAQPSPLHDSLPDALTRSANHANPRQTILTLADLPISADEKAPLLRAMMPFTPGQPASYRTQLLAQSLTIAALKQTGNSYTLQPATAVQLRAVPFTALALAEFPFHTARIISANNQASLHIAEPLTDSPTTLLSMLLNPDTLPLTTARLAVESARATAYSWGLHVADSTPAIAGLSIQNGLLHGTFHGQPVQIQTQGVSLLGVEPFAASAGRGSLQAIVEGNNLLQVITLPPDRVRILATLKGSYIHPLTSDIVFGDVLGNHTDALLINTVPAQIVALTPHNQWQTLWSSGQASFRFETATPQASGADLLIANAPALYSTDPTRYLGGYVYDNHQLKRVFRVYRANLINIQSIGTTNSGAPFLMATVFDQPALMVLDPSDIPWLTLIDIGFAIVILTGLVRRARRRVRRETA